MADLVWGEPVVGGETNPVDNSVWLYKVKRDGTRRVELHGGRTGLRVLADGTVPAEAEGLSRPIGFDLELIQTDCWWFSLQPTYRRVAGLVLLTLAGLASLQARPQRPERITTESGASLPITATATAWSTIPGSESTTSTMSTGLRP